MKKLFGFLLGALFIATAAINITKAEYELGVTDYLIIEKFAERIDEIAAEKGDAFKDGIVILIRDLAYHEKATERVTAVFLVLADFVETGVMPGSGGTTGGGTTGGGTIGGGTGGGSGTTTSGGNDTGTIVEEVVWFDNEGSLFSLVDFVAAFEGDFARLTEENPEDYAGLEYATYEDFSVRVIAKEDLNIKNPTLANIFDSNTVDIVKSKGFLPAEVYMNYRIFDRHLELTDFRADNLVDLRVIMSFEGQDGYGPALNIFMETETHLVGIYNNHYTYEDKEDTVAYIAEIEELIMNGWTAKDPVLYYKEAFGTHKYFTNLVNLTITEGLEVFAMSPVSDGTGFGTAQ